MISFRKSFSKKATQISQKGEDILYGSGITDNEPYSEKISTLTFEEMDQMYLANVWVRSIIDKITIRSSDFDFIPKPINPLQARDNDSVKREIDKANELLMNPNDNFESMGSIKSKLYRDILKFDGSGIEIVSQINLTDKSKNKVELYQVGGDMIKLNPDKRGRFNSNGSFMQVDYSGKIIAKWNNYDFMYFMNNPQGNKTYGLSPLESLVQTVTAELNTSQYNSDFYYNNATPRFAVFMEELGFGQGSPAVLRFKEFWDKELKGKPHSPIIIGTEKGKVKFEKVGLSNSDMQFQEYSAWLLFKIMSIYKMQPVILGISGLTGGTSAGSQNYIEQTNSFKIEAVKPLLKLLASQMNRKVLWNSLALNVKNIYYDFDLDIADKKAESEIAEKYSRMGVLTINEIRIKGLGLEAVEWGDVPYLQNNLAPFGSGPNGLSVPNVNKINKDQLVSYVSNDTLPLGWEHLDPDKRVEIIEKILENKERQLAKHFMPPKTIS